jgi:hypothetical protein
MILIAALLLPLAGREPAVARVEIRPLRVAPPQAMRT